MRRSMCLFALLCGSLVGCLSSRPSAITPEVARQEEDLGIKTVGDVTVVDGVNPAQVHGLGVITGLAGTGHSPPGQERLALEAQFRKQDPHVLKEKLSSLGFKNVKDMLDSSDCALVRVTGWIPPGARRGDTVDVEVSLPPGSKATSLVGGVLEKCPLRTYETTKNLNPDYEGGNRVLQGATLAWAHGPLLVGFSSGSQTAEVKRARVWQGGVSLVDRPYFLVLKKDDQSLRIANGIADRLNLQFREDANKVRMSQQEKNLLLLGAVQAQLKRKSEGFGHDATDMARAVSKELIEIRVPFNYRYNAERYIRVVRLTPLREENDALARYRQRLEKMLEDPKETLRAALRLEAAGGDNEQVLKNGLSHGHPLVRFACAEALSYLGSTAGVDVLGDLARQHSVLTSYCLVALANLDEGVCRMKLAELLRDENPEVRGGAFNALCMVDPTDAALGGESMGGQFTLHRVASGTSPLVSFGVSKRAEIVLFGDRIRVHGPLRVLAGDFTVTAEANDTRCTVSRISAQSGTARKQCSMALEDVLRSLVELEATYPEVVSILKKIDDDKVLSCSLRAQPMPQRVDVETLVENARDPDFLRNADNTAERIRELRKASLETKQP